MPSDMRLLALTVAALARAAASLAPNLHMTSSSLKSMLLHDDDNTRAKQLDTNLNAIGLRSHE